MKKASKAVLISTFLLLSLVLSVYYNLTNPRVLVVHSYDENYNWVKGLNASYLSVLKAYPRSVQLRMHYLGLLGAPNAQHKATAAASALRAVEAFEPDVLVVFDDLAVELVTPALLNRPDLKIVFAGIDGQRSEHGFDTASNTTGILERVPLVALHEAMNDLGRGKALTIACLGDAGGVSVAEARQVSQHDWSPHTLLPCQQAASYAEWQAQVKRLTTQADVLFISGYRGVVRVPGETKVVPPAELMTWTEAHSQALPVAAKNGFVADGGALAISSSPQEQGQSAARLTVALLQGKASKDLPVKEGQAFVVAMHADKLDKRGYRLPKVYEAAARAAGAYY
ncbi:hypothetical protein [Rhodoferax sp.]|uniref:hypothetical protein n=1 Tax=Rhodoferax sp. TaxID=50421 RepID=UPI002609B77B|nr:hypothetical protein [Rhodoferax sp.]MDD2923573.1 hypothetical protein [Rhodoferax sp.]